MRLICISFLILYVVGHGHGQDQIFTLGGDTIVCEILEINKDFILYEKVEDEILKKSRIELVEVASFVNRDPTEDNYIEDLPDNTKTQLVDEPNSVETMSLSLPRLRLELNGGAGYWLVSGIRELDPLLQPYYQNLRWGIQINAHLTWYFSKHVGLGILASQYNASNSEDVVQYNLDGTISNGQIQHDIQNRFYGVSYCTRSVPGISKSSVHLMTSLGWMTHTNQGAFFYKFTERGSTLGVYTGISYDLRVYRGFAIGTNLGVYFGNLKKIEYDDGIVQTEFDLPEGQAISLSRIELGIGIRFKQ